MKKVPIPTLTVAVFMVLVLLTYAVTHQVRFSDVAVRVRFGQTKGVIEDPGLRLRWPWPIESFHTYNKRLEVLETAEAEVTTRDDNNVIVGCTAFWRIQDAEKFFLRIRHEEKAKEQMRSRISATRAAVIGRHDMSDLVNLDKTELDRATSAIQRELLDELGPPLSEQYGIELVRVCIPRISMPEQVTQTVFSQMVEDRQKQATKHLSAGLARAAGIKARAEATKDAILAFAGAKAAEIESAGIRAATRQLEEVKAKDSDFFIWLRLMDALEAGFAERATIFVDTNSELFRQFVDRPGVSVAGTVDSVNATGVTARQAGSRVADSGLCHAVCDSCGAQSVVPQAFVDMMPKGVTAYRCPKCGEEALRLDSPTVGSVRP